MPVVSWSYPLLRFRWCPFRWGAREADLAMQSLLLLMAGIAFYRASPKPRLFAQVCLSIWPLLLRGKKGVDDELLVGCRGWHCGRVTQLVQRLLLCVCVCVREIVCMCGWVYVCVSVKRRKRERVCSNGTLWHWRVWERWQSSLTSGFFCSVNGNVVFRQMAGSTTPSFGVIDISMPNNSNFETET